MTTLLYLMACLMSPAPLIHLAESRVTDSHQTSDFCECFPTAYLQRRYRSGVQNFSYGTYQIMSRMLLPDSSM
jgi:hypothetical protein